MKIIVVGAYGFTGKLVCQQLNSEKIAFAVAGRDTTKLELLADEFDVVSEIITTDITTKKGVDFILNYDIFINCVGPFQLYSELLLEKAVANSKTYIDITGEEVFVSDSIEKYGKIAKQNMALIIHAAAFESALVNVLTHLLLQKNTAITSINNYYRFEKSKPSPGTKFTMKLSKYRDGFFIVDGKKESISSIESHTDSVKIREEIYFPIPYPMPEIPLIHYKFGVNNIASYLLVDAFSANISFEKKEDEDSLTKEIIKFQNRKTKGPTLEQRRAQYFDLMVAGVTDKGEKNKMIISGNDMYLVTAKIISFLIKNELKNPTTSCGILSTHELIKGKEKAFFEYIGVNVTM